MHHNIEQPTCDPFNYTMGSPILNATIEFKGLTTKGGGKVIIEGICLYLPFPNNSKTVTLQMCWLLISRQVLAKSSP